MNEIVTELEELVKKLEVKRCNEYYASSDHCDGYESGIRHTIYEIQDIISKFKDNV